MKLLFTHIATAALCGVLVSPMHGQHRPSAPTDANASLDRAWTMLTHKVGPTEHTEDRIAALAGLGTMERDPRAAHLISMAIYDGNMDVRTAAVLAAGTTHNRELVHALRDALNDRNPQVAYSAAVSLWKMHDTSGEDLLIAVVTGDRPDRPGMLKRERHKAAKEMHDPKALAKIGIDQSAGYVLGPFGFGVKAIEMMHKHGGDPARAATVDLLAEHHDLDARDTLVDALQEKDPAVRAAAARGLGQWPGQDTARILLPLLDDDKEMVRLTAAAAYIRTLQPHPGPREEVQWSEDKAAGSGGEPEHPMAAPPLTPPPSERDPRRALVPSAANPADNAEPQEAPAIKPAQEAPTAAPSKMPSGLPAEHAEPQTPPPGSEQAPPQPQSTPPPQG